MSIMKTTIHLMIGGILILLIISCKETRFRNQLDQTIKNKEVKAKDILGNSDYLAISYGGYRQTSRDIQPTLDEIKDDLKILYAMGIRILRTYNVKLEQAPNVLKAIHEMKAEDPTFEMYVMLGAWIDCKNAWTDLAPDHDIESELNEAEIERAVALATQYPEIVKIIAVGNEAMVKWAESYYVQPTVILKWVNHLQNLKQQGQLSKDLWITCSDDFASWGGADPMYHTPALEALIKAVDYVSMHTYPYHNTHYNPAFWKTPHDQASANTIDQIDAAMDRALGFSQTQYQIVSEYVRSIDSDKTIHIGETGWATTSDGFYGAEGSRATDEYKMGLYYHKLRAWTNSAGISCFYFEAFNEQWKDAGNPNGSENYFGLFDLNGKVKYPLWGMVDRGKFEGLSRNGHSMIKTYDGNKEALMADVLVPPLQD